MTKRQWLYLMTALSVGVLAGAAWPPPPLPKLKHDDSAWSLPGAADMQRHNPQDMATATRSVRWKGFNASGSPGGMRSNWRLAGILDKDGPAVLAMIPGKKEEPQRVLIGGHLPDGSILQSAEGDRATTKQDTCIKTYQLFHAEAVAESAGCKAPEAPAQGTDQ